MAPWSILCGNLAAATITIDLRSIIQGLPVHELCKHTTDFEVLGKADIDS